METMPYTPQEEIDQRFEKMVSTEELEAEISPELLELEKRMEEIRERMAKVLGGNAVDGTMLAELKKDPGKAEPSEVEKLMIEAITYGVL